MVSMEGAGDDGKRSKPVDKTASPLAHSWCPITIYSSLSDRYRIPPETAYCQLQSAFNPGPTRLHALG